MGIAISKIQICVWAIFNYFQAKRWSWSYFVGKEYIPDGSNNQSEIIQLVIHISRIQAVRTCKIRERFIDYTIVWKYQQLSHFRVILKWQLFKHSEDMEIGSKSWGGHLHTFMCCHLQARPYRSNPSQGYLRCEIMTPYHRFSFQKATLFIGHLQMQTPFTHLWHTPSLKHQ